MSYQKIIAGLMTFGFLTACGTSSTTLNQADAVLSLVERGDDFKSLTEDETAALSGTATMKGHIGATNNLNGGTVYLGDAIADFDFESSEIVGTASNFNEYQLAEACAIGFEGCTGEKTRDLDGSMVITGTIDGNQFGYYALGALSGQDEQLGSLVAEVYLEGAGEIGKVDDKLTAVGYGDGTVYIYGPGIDNNTAYDNYGDYIEAELQSGILLQE